MEFVSAMSGALLCGFCTRGRRCALGPDQLGPDAMPIARSEIPAAYYTAGRPLDVGTPLSGRGPTALRDLPQKLRRKAYVSRNAGRESVLNGQEFSES